SKLEQIPEIGSQDKEGEEAAGKKGEKNAADGAAGGFDSPKGKGAEVEPGKTAPPERKEIQVSNVQSSPAPKQGDLPRDDPQGSRSGPGVSLPGLSVPMDGDLAVSVSPSQAAKAKPSATTSPKRPGSATSGPNKKATSPTAGPAASTAKRPGTSTTRPSSLAAKETKPKVADAKPTEKKSSLSKPPSSTTSKTPLKSSPA
ncbi:hypothetical protein N305_03458, partial [Manacus vitellinus]